MQNIRGLDLPYGANSLLFHIEIRSLSIYFGFRNPQKAQISFKSMDFFTNWSLSLSSSKVFQTKDQMYIDAIYRSIWQSFNHHIQFWQVGNLEDII